MSMEALLLRGNRDAESWLPGPELKKPSKTLFWQHKVFIAVPRTNIDTNKSARWCMLPH